MANGGIEVVPQPRLDVLVEDVGGGAKRRRTEYAGTVWFGGRPPPTGSGAVMSMSSGPIVAGFFLPDSLPYDAARLTDAVLSITLAGETVLGDRGLMLY